MRADEIFSDIRELLRLIAPFSIWPPQWPPGRVFVLLAAGVTALAAVLHGCTRFEDVPILDNDLVVVGPLRPTTIRAGNQWIGVRAGQIAEVSQEADPKWVANPKQRSLGSGLYVTPGLVDAHVHLPPQLAPGYLDFFLLMYLAHGVTTIRDLGSFGIDLDAVTESVRAGDRPGPRIVSCGRPLASDPRLSLLLEVVTDHRALDLFFRRQASLGHSCVKLYRGFSGHLLSEAQTLAERYEMRLVGHLPADAPWSSSEIHDIQHGCDPRCSSIRRESADSLASTAKRHRIRHTPTLVAFANPLKAISRGPNDDHPELAMMPRIWSKQLWDREALRQIGLTGFSDPLALRSHFEGARAVVKAMIEAGVPLQVGTDSPYPFVVPGHSAHQEMSLLNELGLSLSHVGLPLRRAPSILRGIGTWQDRGGAPADLLLFRSDPTRDRRVLETLDVVIACGRVYRVVDLKARIDSQLSLLNGSTYRFLVEPGVLVARNILSRSPGHRDPSMQLRAPHP